MIRWMCGVTVMARVPRQELYSRHDIDNISTIVTRKILRWYEPVQCKDDSDFVKRCTEYDMLLEVEVE